MPLLTLHSETLEKVLNFLNTPTVVELSKTCSNMQQECGHVLERRMWMACWHSLLAPPIPKNAHDIVWYLCTRQMIPFTQLKACLLAADEQLIQRLVARNAWNFTDINFTRELSVLDFACEHGHLPLLHVYKRFLDVHDSHLLKETQGRIAHLLTIVAAKGHLHVLKFLKDAFALTADHARIYDNSALRSAASNGHLHVLQFLKEGFGLTLDDARADDNEALQLAARNGHLHVVQFLKEGFGLTSEDARARKNWALQGAAASGELHVVQFLKDAFELTPDDARDDDNYALQCAAANGHLAVVQFMKDAFGLTAADARADNNWALIEAAANGHLDVLRFLKNDFGLTSADACAKYNKALRMATARGHWHVVKFLQEDFGINMDSLPIYCQRKLYWGLLSQQEQTESSRGTFVQPIL